MPWHGRFVIVRIDALDVTIGNAPDREFIAGAAEVVTELPDFGAARGRLLELSAPHPSSTLPQHDGITAQVDSHDRPNCAKRTKGATHAVKHVVPVAWPCLTEKAHG